MPAKTNTPPQLRPYIFHGLDLIVHGSGAQASGACPWCGKESKFTVEIETGKWRCLSCNEGARAGKTGRERGGSNTNAANDFTTARGGNHYTFLRLLWERGLMESQGETNAAERLCWLARDRRLRPETLEAWGVVVSPIRAEDFLVPAFGPGGTLPQLYRYHAIRRNEKGYWKRELWATPNPVAKKGEGLAIFGLNPTLHDPQRRTVYLCEGAWDAMALWETLGAWKRVNDDGKDGARLVPTSNRASSLLADANVLAVPGCRVFQASWLKHFAGKNVVLCYDSDHPRLVNGEDRGRAGWQGTLAVARMLFSSKKKPASVSYLRWHEPDAPDDRKGFDEVLDDGYDVRDLLAGGATEEQRQERIQEFLGSIEPFPEDERTVSLSSAPNLAERPLGSMGVANPPCEEWRVVVAAWKKALRWRRSLDDCLSVLLSVCLSTDQVGDQLFLQLIAEAGSGKTQLCQGLLASGYCYPLEKMRGFLSGWKTSEKNEDGGEKDYSLLARVNHRTLVTAEGDLLLSNPHFAEIMSEQRRIFDGSTTSSYKNRAEDRAYKGLRTPWIIAGTPALLNRADAHLGDRFLRVYIDKPDVNERMEILWRAAHAAERDTLHLSNGKVEETISPRLRDAWRATGGYIDYLRENTERLLAGVEIDEEMLGQAIHLARFTASMRSRPDPNPNSEMVCSEEPTRLTAQFVRLAKNLAAVLQKSEVDAEVMRRVRKVALDTAKGLTLQLCEALHDAGGKGIEGRMLAKRFGLDWKKRVEPILVFLHKIGVASTFQREIGGLRTEWVWSMNAAFAELYDCMVVRET